MHPVGMPPQVAITYNFKVENVGKTPARKAEFRAFGAFAYGSEEKITAFLDESPEGHVAVAPQETRPSKAGLFTVANQPVREPEDAKVGDIVIAISLTYRSGDDGTPRQTARVFHIGKLDPSVGFIQPYRMDQLDTATVFFVQPVGPERIT
jgi:hypothetical protein